MISNTKYNPPIIHSIPFIIINNCFSIMGCCLKSKYKDKGKEVVQIRSIQFKPEDNSRLSDEPKNDRTPSKGDLFRTPSKE